MIQLRHPGREELKDVTMALFERYKEYLLGDYCYGLRSSEDSGSLIPPWTLVLQYEHAIRKHAYKVMATAGYTFGAALVHAYKEPSVKERNFTTPLALHAKRPQPWNATERPTKRKARARTARAQRSCPPARYGDLSATASCCLDAGSPDRVRGYQTQR